MIKCNFCGYENDYNSKYCLKCSKKLNNIISNKNGEINQLKDVYYSYLNDFDGNSIHFSNNFDEYVSNNEKDLFISIFLSSLITGLGLFYLKKNFLGLTLLLVNILLWIITGLIYYLFNIHMINLAYILSVSIYLFSLGYTYKEFCEIS